MGSRVTSAPQRWTSGAEDEGADPLVPQRIFWLLLDSVVHMTNTWNYCLFCLNIRPKRRSFEVIPSRQSSRARRGSDSCRSASVWWPPAFF